MADEALIPILRVNDVDVSTPWYERLGFHLEEDHSVGPEFLRLVLFQRGELRLFLSERPEDGGSSEALVYLRVPDLALFADEFGASVTKTPARRQIELHDPDGNRVRVVERSLPKRPPSKLS